LSASQFGTSERKSGVGYNALAVPTVKPAPANVLTAADAAMAQAINLKAIISPLL